MSEDSVLAASKRDETGSRAVNRLRKQGQLPGVLYGAGEPKSVSVDAATFDAVQRHHTSENVMLTLEIKGDRNHKVLVRDVQHHPLTGAPLHVDFYELSMTKRVTVSIPLELSGEPIGVTRDGGVLEQQLREVEVDCLPDDIIEQIELDVSGLEIGEGLTVADMPLDREKYHLFTSEDIAVASVSAPRLSEEAEEGEEAAEEGAEGEPEVIGEKADEEGEKENEKKEE